MKYLGKKGQKLSVFIILGIFILLIFGLLQFSKDNQLPDVDPEDPETVQIYVESCIALTAEEGLSKLGKQGTLKEQGDFTFDSGEKVYSYTSLTYLDQLEVKRQLENYISTQLRSCLKKLKDPFVRFPETQPKTELLIKEEDIDINVKYDVEVVKNERRSVYNEFSTSILVQLGNIIDTIQNIYTDGFVLQDYEDLGLYMNRIDDDKTIVRIYDKKYTIKDEVYYFSFVFE
tara:strand:- start:4610 stop:5302 length:693 start_codon:yes stop_codon:yes gene_type:complete